MEPTPPAKILIAEDDPASRVMLAKFISNFGHDVTLAEDGQQAWELWQQFRHRIVISDWVMPRCTGVDLCSRIRENEGSQYTYLIMVTAKKETADLIEAIDAGADDFITKPYIREELGVRIRAGLRVTGFETKDLVIFSLAKLAESRDLETGNHLERIRHYSKILAAHLAAAGDIRINSLFVENIFLTSPLHDIGKVGIPDSVLLKPGPLTPSEFLLMQSHCEIGYQTLYEALKKYPKTDYLTMGADIARYHHEKFNGTGYPTGLGGEEIPLAARIVAVADVYDALISKRSYKTAITHDKAKDILLKDSGSHFDPVIIDAFLACEKEFLFVAERFGDKPSDITFLPEN